MKPTGKCKQEFEKWLENRFKDIQVSASHQLMFSPYYHFHLLPESMQYGVLVDYFDSVGIYIDIDTEMVIGDYFEFTIDGKDGHKGNGLIFKTRQEARTKAIEKANEIRNEQLK